MMPVLGESEAKEMKHYLVSFPPNNASSPLLLIYERGVDDAGFGRIRSKGDEALFGGKDTKQMKTKLNIPQNRPIADFLPTVTITAKNLATEITNFNVKKENLNGEN